MTFSQAGFEVRCEWGPRGLRELAGEADVVVVVDVLSFTTALDVATARGALVFPVPLEGEGSAGYAASLGAELAPADRGAGLSLSPASLRSIGPGVRLVLPSPNGSALSFSAAHASVLAACLRNASAAAALAGRLGSRIAVIPAGETWDTGEFRPCLEDLVGAGAVIRALTGTKSPEARLAAAAFDSVRARIREALFDCGSGRELVERGFAEDVELAAAFNVSNNVPRLVDRGFVGTAVEPPHQRGGHRLQTELL